MLNLTMKQFIKVNQKKVQEITKVKKIRAQD